MVTQKKIKLQVAFALQEIGGIKPWWSEEDQMFVFEHPLYPRVMHADPDIEETIQGYLRALHGFIEDRLHGHLSDTAERVTSGRGGKRPGAGRPKKPVSTVAIRLPNDIANWLKADPRHMAQVRKIMGN